MARKRPSKADSSTPSLFSAAGDAGVSSVGDDAEAAAGADARSNGARESAGAEDSMRQAPKKRTNQRKAPGAREDVKGIQDLLWREGLLAVQALRPGDDERHFREHLRDVLPQNSESTRNRYAQNLMRWFFPDGLHGLAAQVWLTYREPALTGEILRYLYLNGEPMVGRVVSEALFPIADNSVIPGSYINNFVRTEFGEDIPDKSIKRVKANLRKLGILARDRSNKDTLRPLNPSPTAFMIVAHHLFANKGVHAVEFKNIVDDPFWKYLGFKTEDRLRAILKEALASGVITKYVVADRIESISLKYSFREFVDLGVRS